MKTRKWLAVAVIAVWVGQTVNLWPLPSDVAAQVSATANAAEAQAIAQYESTLWLGWALRAFAIPLGVLSGVLLMRNHPKWAVVLLVTSVACLLLFRPWQWLSLYTPLFASVERAIGRGSWLIGQPRLLYNTVVFPGILVLASICAGVEVFRQRRGTHAI